MIYTELNIKEIKEKLQNCLTEERYIHSVGVMEMAVELAQRFNCDKDKAKIAGLLHDCAKCMKKEEFFKYDNLLLDCEKQSIKTWHAPIGAIIAKNEYGIKDEEILSAIRWHTIGKTNMSVFEKIIFIADKIECKTREKKMREEIESALNIRNNLDDAMLTCFKITIKSLIERNLSICFQTVEVYNDFINSVLNNQNSDKMQN